MYSLRSIYIKRIFIGGALWDFNALYVTKVKQKCYLITRYLYSSN